MHLEKLPTGNNPPEDVYVVIEVPANGPGLKIELDKASGALLVDRFLATPMHYPCNYGFIPHTLSEDGDPLDALVIAPMPLIPGVVVQCRPVAILSTKDDAGEDAKIVCVPVSKLTREYASVQELADLPQLLVKQIEHFFSHYKDLEPGKWMNVAGWGSCADAKAEILRSVERYKICSPRPNF